MGGHFSGLFSSPSSEATTYHQLKALDVEKNAFNFESLKGKVVLVSNVAANYKAFAELMEKYGDRGFTIQAFPCNQFGFQEPGTNEEIKAFAAARGFTGILMDKINVNGKNASPVFDFLKVGANDTSLIGWNFAKFLVRKDGSVAGRFSPKTNPMELETQIEELLKQE